jgi:hypothetical protein
LNLKVYQIIQLPKDEESWDEIVKNITVSDFFPGEQNLRYCINKEFVYENGIFVGAIHEEYIPDQTSVDEDREELAIDNIEPWERTIFAIDFQTKKLLVQQRDYSPRNLSRTKCRSRITQVLEDAWQTVYGLEFNYIITNLLLGNDYFIDNFVKNTRVLGAKLKFNEGWRVSDIYDGSDMINEWKELWNSDISELNEITLKAKSNGDLTSSPIFKLAFSSSGLEIESITYYDSSEDKPKTESRTMFDQIEVADVTKRTEILLALNETNKEMVSQRPKLRALRAISLD